MEKNKVAAYLITESVTNPAPVNNLKVHDKDSIFYLRFETCLQDFNVFNRNRRMYMGEAMVPSLNAEHIIELEQKGSWFGEAGHPDSNDPKRILTINPDLISHKIVSHNVNTQKCTGVVETLCNDRGRNMANLILQGMEPAFSLRALAPLVKKDDGSSIIKAKAHVVTYDWVILPSHKAAYRDTSKPVEKIIKSISDSGNVVTTEASLLEVSENCIRDFVLDQSMNVKIVSNVCEVCLDNAVVSADRKSIIIRENSDTYIVPIEDKIREDVAAYMRNL